MANIDISKIGEALNGKADLDLNNTGVFSTNVGGGVNLTISTPAGAESKEVVSADFLPNYVAEKADARIENKFSQVVTNCITEIPQYIKVEIFTESDFKYIKLLAGSKIWYPQGFEADGVTRKFNYRIIENDVVFDGLFWSETNLLEQAVILFDDGSTVSGTTSARVGANITSGETAPTTFSQTFALWYDTKENYVKYTSDSGATWVHASFPVFEGRPVTSEGWTKGVEHIFNGFGYIGSTLFALPGVKGLIPNGRNDDGSLKNTAFETSGVLVRTLNETRADEMQILLDASYLGNSTITQYNAETNYNYRNDTGEKNVYCCAGRFYRSTSGVITKFTPAKTVQAIDRNDGNFLSAQSMPSSKYINLTLGSSDTTYTAPANGWFCVETRVSNQTGSYQGTLRNETCGGWLPLGGYSYFRGGGFLPVRKGDIVKLYREDKLTFILFRFVYADGET